MLSRFRHLLVVGLAYGIAAMGCDQAGRQAPEGLTAASAKALSDLILGLKSRDSVARTRSAAAIGRMGPRAAEAVPALEAALKDRQLSVRAAAAHALGQIGPAARPALGQLESLSHQGPLREVAARAIAQIGAAEE
jgi:HEAT repeat protein